MDQQDYEIDEDDAMKLMLDEKNNKDPFEMLLQRGAYLRQLRLMEAQDEDARRCSDVITTLADRDEGGADPHPAAQHLSTSTLSHPIIRPPMDTLLPSGNKILHYESFLLHQLYYDDLKHVDYKYIEYCRTPGLVIEQDKYLGKGGICWDAAFVLGEHLIATADQWRRKSILTAASLVSSSECRSMDHDEDSSNYTTESCTGPTPTIESSSNTTLILELGAGTGLCGFLVGKAIPNVHVTLTDLPKLMNLLSRNMNLNFRQSQLMSSSHFHDQGDTSDNQNDIDNDEIYQYYWNSEDGQKHRDQMSSLGTVTVSSLQWGDGMDTTKIIHQQNGQFFDLIIGADVVASIYDIAALVTSICDLCTTTTLVLISFKERLSSVQQQFEEAMSSRFVNVNIVNPIGSRNRNPDIRILVASQIRKV